MYSTLTSVDCCPPGSELADAKHTKILSAQEQAQIKKTVQGFMALDSAGRRSAGHPLGSSEFWEKGYTAKFNEAKDVPSDWVRYIAYRHSNICVNKDGAFAAILLDVADLSGRKIEKILDDGKRFLSPQAYWDALSKAKVVLSDDSSSPE